MPSSRSRRTAALWCACAAACVMAAPVCAQTLSPIQGAREALTRAHGAKNLGELNNSLTNESAAGIGFGLVFVESMMSGMATTMTDALTPKGAKPKGMARQEAAEAAFQNKVEALLKRYSLDEKAPKGGDKSDTLPPSLIIRGHQFLADALALSDDFEKSHASSKNKGTLGSQISGSDLPAPEACDFHVLSPSHVQIVPHDDPKSPIDAMLEDGQWRIDPPSQKSSSDSKPAMKTISRQAAALLKAIRDRDPVEVAQKLKADPASVNSPEGYYHGTTGVISDMPLTEAAFYGDLKIIALLLQYGAKVNAEGILGEDALDSAVFHSGKEAMALLIAHGADVKHKDQFGRTALHVAAQEGDPDKIALLLAHGADVNARDEDGRTPLSMALASTFSDPDHVAALKLLRQHGGKK